MYDIRNIQKTDIVVLGGGLAAMYAAISAAENDANVTIISKKEIGRSGSSVISKSVHRYSPNLDIEKSKYLQKVINAGRFINNKELVEILVEQGSERVNDLHKQEVSLNHKYISIDNSSYSNFSSCKPMLGKNITFPVSDYIRTKTNIKVLEGYMGFELDVNNNKVSGIYLEKNNKIFYISTKSVILATGGFGYIYSNTTNTRDLTGDGCVMAYNKNLPLQDMEFVQFYPYRVTFPFQYDVFPEIFEHGAFFVNEKNERFMNKYAKKELENRDVLAREIFLQNEVYLVLEECDEEYMTVECEDLYRKYIKHRGEKLLVKALSHFTMGGVSINQNCSTNIEGLFCCGELTGGLHGANRLGGNALTETVVFGKIAGESASNFIKERVFLKRSNLTYTLPYIGDTKVENMVSSLRKIMWENVGIVRSEKSLLFAKYKIINIKNNLFNIYPKYLKDWIELNNMIKISEIIIDASLKRKESRGAHFRSDYPYENSKMIGNIIAEKDTLEFVPIDKTIER